MLDIFRPKQRLVLKCLAELTYVATRWKRPLRFGKIEEVCAMYLNEDNVLLEFCLVAKSDRRDYVQADFIEIFKRGAAIGAKKLVIFHNHVSEDVPEASDADWITINRAKILATEWNIVLLESIITSKNYAYAMLNNETFGISEFNNQVICDISNQFKKFKIRYQYGYIPPFVVIKRNIALTFMDKIKILIKTYERWEKETAKPIQFSDNTVTVNSILSTKPYCYNCHN